MNEKINEIYTGLCHSLPVLEQVSYFLYRQEYFEASAKLKWEMTYLESMFVSVLEQREYFQVLGEHAEQEYVLFLLKSIIDAMERKEYVLLSDVLTQLVVPWCYEVQELIVGRELSEVSCLKKNGTEYWTEYTAVGVPTIRVVAEQEFYIHSNRNAITEAERLADSWYKEEAEQYILFGMGLGYAARALLEKSEYFTVKIFESDTAILELSKKVGCYEELMETGRVEIIVDEEGKCFAEEIQENPQAEIGFFYPSIRLLRQKELRERFEDTFMRYMSEKGQYRQLHGNFKRNIEHYDAPAEVLKPLFAGKRVYLVAGGPSLDKNVECLREIGENDIILAMGTVLRKLLHLGLRVDYFAITDAKARTFRQVEGIECAGIPLLGLSTAYYRFFTDYQAKHYLLCQEGFAAAEQLAEEKGYTLIQTGGSVTTAALDAALMLGAAEIVFVGLDLAFTGGRDHASDTLSIAENISGDQRMVQDIYGNRIQTGRNLDIYRRFIEQQIAKHPKVRFIDATEGGARIAGTELLRLKDVIFEKV